MTSTSYRRLIRLAIILVLLVGGGFLGAHWLARTVLARSKEALQDFSGPGSDINIGGVQLDLLAGNIRWSDVRIGQPTAQPDTTLDDRTMRVSGHVDEIAVRGLSLWGLLVSHKLSMRSISIMHPDIEVILMNDTSSAAEKGSGGVDFSAFNSDSLLVERAAFRTYRMADSATFSLDTFGLRVTGLRSQWKPNTPFALSFTTADGRVSGIHALFPPVYDLRVATIALEDGGRVLQLLDAALTPLKGPQEYGQVIHFETDLFAAHVDTVRTQGLDLNALITDRTLTLSTMRLAGVDLNIFRDKTMPDEPYKHKPLPARMLRKLPIRLCMDSVVVDRWNVNYHEKSTLTPDYGEVVFNDIHGVVTGLCSVDSTSRDTLFVNATARAYDKTNISLKVRTVIADRSDRFTADARIGGLPFDAFNRMTRDLILVRATAGTIGGIDLTMTADDNKATGRVDMEYDGFKVELLKQDGSGEKRKFLSGLVNQVVHSSNLRSDAGFRHGDFSFERRKDRSIFNYLWSGLREGMIASVLPGTLEDLRQAQKAVKNP